MEELELAIISRCDAVVLRLLKLEVEYILCKKHMYHVIYHDILVFHVVSMHFLPVSKAKAI